MALTITSRGTGTHNTGATTLVPGGRSATLAVGSMGVLCLAGDNAGAAGAALMAPASWTDAKGNVWTLRTNALYDNGAASAGIEMMFYTAPITVALLTTDLGTITWAGGVSPVAKAWTWYEVIPSGANTVAYSTGGSIAGATAANAQVITASVTVGDGVIAGYFSENVAAVTGDADTTNGTWTAQQTATVGTTTSGVRIATQQKVQTTAASTQSYDATVVSQDRIAGYILLHEVVDTTVTPGVLALTTAAFAPTVTVSNNQLATPDTLALTTATFAPTVTATQNVTVTPSTLALTLTTFAPTVTATDHKTVTPGVLALTTATYAPTVTASDNKTATPDVVALTLATFAPTVTSGAGVIATPGTAALTITTFAPTVSVSDNKTVTPGTVALALTAYAPTVTASDNIVVTPGVVALNLSAYAPTVTASDNKTVTPGTVALSMTAFAPNVVASDQKLVTPATVALSLSTFAPTAAVSDNIVVTPGVVALNLAAFAPTVAAMGSSVGGRAPGGLAIAPGLTAASGHPTPSASSFAPLPVAVASHPKPER